MRRQLMIFIRQHRVLALMMHTYLLQLYRWHWRYWKHVHGRAKESACRPRRAADSYPLHIREMMLRRGPLPSSTCVLILVQFVLDQFRVVLQCPSLRDRQDIYNLSIGKFNYVGRTQTFRNQHGEVDLFTDYVSIYLHCEVTN